MKLNYLSCGVVCLLAYSLVCEGACTPQHHSTPDVLPKAKIVIIDSIKINRLGELRIVAHDTTLNAFLGCNIRSGDVVVFDKTGKVLTEFNRSGDSPDAFGDLIVGAGFYANNQIAILSRKGLFFYDFEGNLLRKINRPYSRLGAVFMNFQSKLYFFEHHSQPYMACTLEGVNMEKVSSAYYDNAKFVTLVNLKTESFELFTPYPQNSIYRGDKNFYDSDRPIFTYSPSDASLYVLYGFESNLYQCHLEDLNSLEAIGDLTPQHLIRLSGEPYGKAPSPEKIFYYTYASGQYYDLFMQHDTLYAAYLDGLPADKIAHKLSLPEYFKLFKQEARSHLQVVVKGKKIYQDILLPKEALRFELVLPNGTFLMTYRKEIASQEPNYEMLYVGKIQME